LIQIQAARDTLAKRRDHVFSLYEQVEAEIQQLQAKADTYEDSLEALKKQIEALDVMIKGSPEPAITNREAVRAEGVVQNRTPRPPAQIILRPAPVVAKRIRPKLNFREVLNMMRGRAFCVNDVYNFAMALPEPIQYSKDSISVQLSRLKRDKVIKVYSIRDGEGWLYCFPGDEGKKL
jgi:hypothetical protein